MNLLGTPKAKDDVAREIIADISRVNNLTAAQTKPEWVNVTVGYRLVGYDAILREAAMQQQAAEVPEILSRLAQHVKLAYGQMSAEILTGNEKRRRFITFDIADLLFVEITSEPYEPEQTQDDERRAKLRGRRSHGIDTSAVNF